MKLCSYLLIHVLRHVGPGAVNRDREGFLKTITIGGVPRIRFSQTSYGDILSAPFRLSAMYLVIPFQPFSFY